MPRRRVLFFSEGVTLAQVVRLVALAESLPRDRFEVHFASAAFEPMVFDDTSFVRWPVKSVDAKRVLAGLEQGKWIYNKRLLARYVEDDRRILDAMRPDLVVGDMRLSLSVSARVAGVPFLNLINAYWSPYALRDNSPIPDHPIIKLVGLEKAQRYFPQALPHVFRRFAAPVNQLRREFGLPELGDLPHVLTDGDHVLHPDVPQLVATRRLPGHHHFIGPVLWQPRGTLPAEWLDAPEGCRRIYVSLGSSGRRHTLPKVLAALSHLDARVLLATAQHEAPRSLPDNVIAAAYVPGQEAARYADLVVSNGGSSTGYQALAEGTPVIGVASNFDQYLAMEAIERAGAGITLRAGLLSERDVAEAVTAVFDQWEFRQSAAFLSRAFERCDYRVRFPRIVETAVWQFGPTQSTKVTPPGATLRSRSVSRDSMRQREADGGERLKVFV